MNGEAIIDHLRDIVGPDYVTNDPAELWCYSGNLLPKNPQFVVRPADVQEIVEVVKLAVEARLPIIPRGFATRSTPRRPGKYPTTEGGLILEMDRLKRIRHIDQVSRTVTAESGVTIAELANHLAPMGWRVIEGTMTPYCATVGSLTGVGPGLWKYGKREEHILDIEVVLSSGDVIRTSAADGAGVDLTELFIACQGLACLGVITAVTYRMHSIPETFDYLNFEFMRTSDTIEFLLKIDHSGLVDLPGIFQVNVYPEAVFHMYSKMPWIRDQNVEFSELLERYPPFPADVVGIILEGTEEQVALERERIKILAGSSRGEFVGPEPVRDYYANRNWTGNTKCHEDVSCSTTSWTEPFFLCDIPSYEMAKKIVENAARENGFAMGERFWARGTLRKGLLGYTACVTFDDTDQDERDRADAFVRNTLATVKEVGLMKANAVSSNIHVELLREIKKFFDPHDVVYPGILFLD
jgi:FAD/FMN-containing dehydrogenase